ncbi:Rap1a/Tai family immunity protein [uncultured Marinobacter sp.]|uniref:Rap1a/Tai family immunity protein n=1 Tax=uncultured Marinobacter sp. TaxID=187379 RepID=UPI00260169EB|nr:Rap1a/Tai family immunity protein [uncultured Marinobacter sp.]
MSRKSFLLALFIIALPSHSWADGNELLQRCVETQRALDGGQLGSSFDAGFCMGTVAAVRDTMSIMSVGNKDLKMCFPEQMSNGQAVRVVVQYLKNNPKILHRSGTLLVMSAYVSAYSCD